MNTGKIYEEGIPSKRTGPIYNSVPYPTKIDPEAIAVLIATHTRPGDTVCDIFGGSCMTGVAARLCDAPTERMKRLAKEMDVSVNWGARKSGSQSPSGMRWSCKALVKSRHLKARRAIDFCIGSRESRWGGVSCLISRS